MREFYSVQHRLFGRLQSPQLAQHTVEVNFRVETLRVSLFKSFEADERELGNVCFEQFALAFALAKYTMTVDINLRYFNYILTVLDLYSIIPLGRSPWT